ncbi:MAG: MATE family efflux transporter [archaeon]
MTKNKVDEFIKSPRKSLFILAYPVVIAMLVQVLYNIVDTAFVGRIGAEAIAALTFSFPIFFILLSINSGVGTGMASMISRFLGAKDKKSAENTAIHGILISIGLAVIIFFAAFFLLDPLFSVLGASGIALTMATDYFSIVLVGIFFMFPSFMLINMFIAQGDTKTPMKIQITALVINIILDPIFIYVLGLGVKGAAMATTISFFFALMLSIYYMKKKSYLCLSRKCFRYSTKVIKEIFSIGIPTTLMMVMVSLYVLFLNRFAASFSIEHVATLGITFRLDSLAFLPIVGFTTALMTLVGMFYGAKRYDLLKGIVSFAIKIGLAFTLVIAVIFFFFPEVFLRIFTDDPTLLSWGASYMRIYVWTFPLVVFTMAASRTLQAIGKGMPGLIINVIRVLVAAVPLAYLFIFVLGYGFLSIATAMLLGNVVGVATALIILRHYFKKLGILDNEKKPVAN